MSHTKGEWAWQLFGDTYMLAAQHGRREIIIGAINAPTFNYPTPAMSNNGILQVVDKDHPNAKLIAASPELLAALESVMDLIDSGDLVRDISKDADFDYFKNQGIRITTSLASAVTAIKKATP